MIEEPPCFFIFFSIRFSFSVFCAFFFVSFFVSRLWAIHHPFLHTPVLLSTSPILSSILPSAIFISLFEEMRKGSMHTKMSFRVLPVSPRDRRMAQAACDRSNEVGLGKRRLSCAVRACTHVNGLTARQRSVFEYVCAFMRERGYPPTIREIRDAFHLKSNRGVVDHLRALERKGYIRRVPGISRAIEIEAGPHGGGRGARGERGFDRAIPSPAISAAGRPEPPAGEADRNIILDDALFAERGDFILEVKGDSMIDDHIVPGDLIVVRKVGYVRDAGASSSRSSTARRRSSATFARRGRASFSSRRIPKYEPIVLSGADTRDCAIIGTVVGVIRSHLQGAGTPFPVDERGFRLIDSIHS